jgi:hypothetical protein
LAQGFLFSGKKIHMKKLLVLLLLASVSSVNAQSDSELKFGPRVGVNISNFSNVDDSDGLIGLVAGGYAVYSFHEHFGISLDLLYSMEGAKSKATFNFPDSTVTQEQSIKLSYLRVPLLLNVFFGELGNPIRPKLMVGPSLGFLMGVKTESEFRINDSGVITEVSTSSSEKEGYNTIDFGAVAGAGVNIRLADRLWLDTDLRYYIGASDLFEDSPSGEDTPKNNHLQVSLGLGIGLNR